MGKPTLYRQIDNHIRRNGQFMKGISRHQTKQNMRSAAQHQGHVLKASDSRSTVIHSTGSKQKFNSVARMYTKFLVDEIGIDNKSNFFELDHKKYTHDFLEYRREREKPKTIQTDRTELKTIFQYSDPELFREIGNYKLDPISKYESTRGRTPPSEKIQQKYAREIEISDSFGLRVDELRHIGYKDVHYTDDGLMYLDLHKDHTNYSYTKNGKQRYSFCLPEKQARMEQIFKENQENSDRKTDHHYIVDRKISHDINNHYFRGDYARQMYDYLEQNQEFRSKLENFYQDKDGHLRIEKRNGKLVKSTEFKIRSPKAAPNDTFGYLKEHDFTFNRDSMYLVSKILGHERITDLAPSYFR